MCKKHKHKEAQEAPPEAPTLSIDEQVGADLEAFKELAKLAGLGLLLAVLLYTLAC